MITAVDATCLPANSRGWTSPEARAQAFGPPVAQHSPVVDSTRTPVVRRVEALVYPPAPRIVKAGHRRAPDSSRFAGLLRAHYTCETIPLVNEEAHAMKQLVWSLGVALVCAALAAPPLAAAQERTAIPSAITTPDKVDSRIGSLDFTDGMPGRATLDAVYDNLDFTHAFEAFVNTMQAVNAAAIQKCPR